MLNIIACFCVICMHCNGIVHRYSNSAEWKQSMIVETIAYWAVPVFFMMSGATLMNYGERYDIKTHLKKRFLRVGIPFNSSLSFPMTGGYVLYAICYIRICSFNRRYEQKAEHTRSKKDYSLRLSVMQFNALLNLRRRV